MLQTIKRVISEICFQSKCTNVCDRMRQVWCFQRLYEQVQTSAH